MLEIRNLSIAIDGKPLFINASTLIPTSHKVGIVGLKGAGKIGLFRLIRKEWGVDGRQLRCHLNLVLAASIKRHQQVILAFLKQCWPLTMSATDY